ncbi:hypothetical protein ACFFRR_004161 [Megaselia abdita]
MLFNNRIIENKKMAFLVTEIAMDVMDCKYFDIDGLAVSSLENLVRYNKAGNLETMKCKTLNDYLSDEVFHNSKGERINLQIVLSKSSEAETEAPQRMSYPPQPVNKNGRGPIPKISSARSLATNPVNNVTRPQPTEGIQQRRPSFMNTFSNFVADQSKPKEPVTNSNASLFQRSMTQIGNRKIVIKPKPAPPKVVQTITVPVKTTPPVVSRIMCANNKPQSYAASHIKMPKVISVRPNAPTPMVSGGGGTQFKGPQPAVSGGSGTFVRQYRNEPAVSAVVTQQYQNEPAPAVSGGGGTQFGGQVQKTTNDADHSVPKVSRILHRRHTLFQKQPY